MAHIHAANAARVNRVRTEGQNGVRVQMLLIVILTNLNHTIVTSCHQDSLLEIKLVAGGAECVPFQLCVRLDCGLLPVDIFEIVRGEVFVDFQEAILATDHELVRARVFANVFTRNYKVTAVVELAHVRVQIGSRNGLKAIVENLVRQQVRLQQIVAEDRKSVGSAVFAIFFGNTCGQDVTMGLNDAKNCKFVASFLRKHEDHVTVSAGNQHVFTVLWTGNTWQVLLVVEKFELLQNARLTAIRDIIDSNGSNRGSNENYVATCVYSNGGRSLVRVLTAKLGLGCGFPQRKCVIKRNSCDLGRFSQWNQTSHGCGVESANIGEWVD